MLADKNKDIGKAFNILEIISQDEHARMVYEPDRLRFETRLCG